MDEDKRLYEEGGGTEGVFSLCQQYRARFQDMMEGYLDAITAEAIRAHLAVCYLCSKEYKDLAATVRFIESLPFAESGRDFAPAVLAAIDKDQGLGSWKIPAWLRWRPRPRGP